MPKNESRAGDLLKAGAPVAGTAVGAAVGFFVGGPPGTVSGAMLGAAVSKTCELVVEDMACRMLSFREQMRVGGVAALAAAEIAESLLWQPHREDGFFDLNPDGSPSPAEELFEGVLLAAKQEHEQKKLPYLASFYANIVFTPYVKAAEANHLLYIAESLTYQQFCILGLIAQKEEFQLRDQAWPKRGVIPAEKLDLAQQAFYLYQRQLLLSIDPQVGTAGFVYEVSLVLPTQCHLSPTGARLVELLDLKKINPAELRTIAEML